MSSHAYDGRSRLTLSQMTRMAEKEKQKLEKLKEFYERAQLPWQSALQSHDRSGRDDSFADDLNERILNVYDDLDRNERVSHGKISVSLSSSRKPKGHKGRKQMHIEDETYADEVGGLQGAPEFFDDEDYASHASSDHLGTEDVDDDLNSSRLRKILTSTEKPKKSSRRAKVSPKQDRQSHYYREIRDSLSGSSSPAKKSANTSAHLDREYSRVMAEVEKAYQHRSPDASASSISEDSYESESEVDVDVDHDHHDNHSEKSSAASTADTETRSEQSQVPLAAWGSAQAELVAVNNLLQEKTSKLAELEDRLRAQEKALKEREDALADDEQAVLKSRDSLRKKEHVLDETIHDQVEVRAELAVAKERENFRKELNRLQNALDDEKRNSSRLTDTVRVLRGQENKLRRELQESEKARHEVEEECRKMKTSIFVFSKEKRSLEGDMLQLQQEIERLSAEQSAALAEETRLAKERREKERLKMKDEPEGSAPGEAAMDALFICVDSFLSALIHMISDAATHRKHGKQLASGTAQIDKIRELVNPEKVCAALVRLLPYTLKRKEAELTLRSLYFVWFCIPEGVTAGMQSGIYGYIFPRLTEEIFSRSMQPDSNVYLNSPEVQVRVLASGLLVRCSPVTVNSFERVTAGLECLRRDLIYDNAKEYFVAIHGFISLLHLLHVSQPAVLSSLSSILLTLSVDSPFLDAFLDACFCDTFFDGLRSALKLDNVELHEALCVILQKMMVRAPKRGRMLVEKFNLTLTLANMKLQCPPEHEFLRLNLQSIADHLDRSQ